jgi:hypothetical protein
MGYCVLSVDYQRLNHEGTFRIALLLANSSKNTRADILTHASKRMPKEPLLARKQILDGISMTPQEHPEP